jgi:hypothetical protein
MTMLADPTLERLCDLFASGSMEHAKEIARLLVEEIKEPRPRRDAALASDLLRWAAIALQTQYTAANRPSTVD